MTQLTKEYFDQIVAGLATKQVISGLATKDDVGSAEKRIIERIDASQAELAGMVKNGFDATDKNFVRLADMLHVHKDVDNLKLQMLEIRQALNLKK